MSELMPELLYMQALSTRSARSADDMVGNIFDKRLNRMGEPSLIVLPEYFIDGQEMYEGVNMADPMINALENYSKVSRSHIVSGMVEVSEEGDKYITGLLFGPDSGLIGKRRKARPTPFEMENGVIPGEEPVLTFQLDNGLGTLAIAMSIESFELDAELRSIPAEILVNPRGFGLDNDRFGIFSRDWLAHNQDLARMGKRIVAGATGHIGESGFLAEIIDSEGHIADSTSRADNVIEGYMDMERLRNYREGSIQSKYVPIFPNRFSETTETPAVLVA
jgi:predicted amidohydrolase